MRYNKRLLLLIVLSLFTFFACKKDALVEDDSEMRTYNFSSDKCDVTFDQSFLLSGISTLTKIDVNGNISWKINNYKADHTLPLTNTDFIQCINSGDTMVTISRYNAQSNLIRTQGIYMYDYSPVYDPRVVELSSGELMIFGTSYFGYDSIVSIIKTDKNLAPIWSTKVKINSDIFVINKLKEVSSDGNILLIGNTEKSGGKNNITYAMIDSAGALHWDHNNTFGIWENYPTDIQQINSQEYIITGYFDQGGDVDFDFQFFAFKINSLGNSIGLLKTGGSKQDYCLSSIYTPSNGNLIMVGMEGRGQNYNDLNLSNIKIVTINPSPTSSSNSIISDRSYAKLQSCSAMCAIYNTDGSMSVIGRKNAFENKNLQNTFFLKIKPDGSF